MRQTFEDYRAKTIRGIKERKKTSKGVRIFLNDTTLDGYASTNYIENRERLKTDEEFLTFFKQHFWEEL